MEAGRKDWLLQGLEDGANLEAFALFFFPFFFSSLFVWVGAHM